MPSHLPTDVRRRLEPVRLLVLDVDGVLTDGSLYYGADGEAMKAFSVRDGLAIRLLEEAGVRVGIITGRTGAPLAARARDLRIDPSLVVQGSRDKSADLDAMMTALGLSVHEVAAMGDDLPDLPLLTRVGFAACPSDAAPEVVASCHHVCGAAGGRGAVREVGELLLKAKGRWSDLVDRRFSGAAGSRAGEAG